VEESGGICELVHTGLALSGAGGMREVEDQANDPKAHARLASG